MKICPFISHMLGEDRADVLQIDGPAPGSKSTGSPSGNKGKSGDVVILGYGDGADQAVGVATETTEEQNTDSSVPTHLYCLKETCRFFKKNNGDCKFESMFDEVDAQTDKLSGLEAQTRKIDDLENQLDVLEEIEKHVGKIDSIAETVKNQDSVKQILKKIEEVATQVRAVAERPRDTAAEKAAAVVTRELDKFWKFQTKSVSEMISSIGEAEKKQDKSLSSFQKEILRSTRDQKPAVDPKSIEKIAEQLKKLHDAVESREDGIDNFSTTVSELVMNLDDTLKQVRKKSEFLAQRIQELEDGIPDGEALQKNLQKTVREQLEQSKSPDLSNKIAALNSRFEEVLDAGKNLEKQIDRWRDGVETRITEMREQQDEWKQNLDNIEAKQTEIVRLLGSEPNGSESASAGHKKKEAKKFNNLGVTSFHNGELELARDQFLEAVTLDPLFAEAWNNLGLVYTEMQDDDEATRAFSRTVEINPDLPAAYNNLGYIHYKQENYEKAVEMYNEAINRSSDNCSAYTNLGNAYYKLGKPDDARQAWEKALEIDPGNEKASRNLERLDKE